MLRKLDAARLEELLKGAERLRWQLKAQVRDDAARKFLEEFEQAVENFRKQLASTVCRSSAMETPLYGSSSIALRRRTTSPPAWSGSPITASRYLGPTTCFGITVQRTASTKTLLDKCELRSPAVSSFCRSSRSARSRGERPSFKDRCLQRSLPTLQDHYQCLGKRRRASDR